MPVTEEMTIPFDFHRFIIGQKGRDVRAMMDEYDVNISIPPANEGSDVVKITGSLANVSRAREAMLERIQQLEDNKADRVRVRLLLCLIFTSQMSLWATWCQKLSFTQMSLHSVNV